VRAERNKWWLLPLGILTVSALAASSVIIFELSFVGQSAEDVAAQRAASELPADCSGALATDYPCHQERYQDLVRDSSVEAAFAELKDEHTKNEFVKSYCHQLTHVIGRAAAERYGDLPSTYGRGDHFCASGYFHGAMEAIVAKIGADNILNEANTLCVSLRENQNHSVYHHNCAHGLGHGFMGVYENELFESLYACDALMDEWEEKSCFGGVFMENVMAENNPSHPSKYLRADQPLYPCTVVENRYKTQCYGMQPSYALKTEAGDFAKVFDLCAEVEDDFRPACYRSLGRDAFGRNLSDVEQAGSTSKLCMLGEDYEARSNCVAGAVGSSIYHYHDDAQAKVFCESLEADLRIICLQTAKQ
jgi:hypothetical protein